MSVVVSGASPRPVIRVASAEDFRQAFGVSRETTDRLEVFADLLMRWQKVVNLIAPGTVSELWQRHLADSAQLVRLVPADVARWVDLGSGGGLPGIVVAAMLDGESAAGRRAPVRTTLVESDQRKAAFLREAARTLALPVEILCARIENRETQRKLATVQLLSARALAPLERLLEWTEPLFSAETLGLFPKGRGVEAEVSAAERSFHFEYRLEPSLTDPEAAIVVIRRPASKTEE